MRTREQVEEFSHAIDGFITRNPKAMPEILQTVSDTLHWVLERPVPEVYADAVRDTIAAQEVWDATNPQP